MGSYSPVPAIDEDRAREICAAVSTSRCSTSSPAAGTPFHGVLYAGLMMTADGPKVLEFNVRFGDPETQAILPRLRSDLLELLDAACRPGGLARRARWSGRPETAVTVVLASAGYPESSSGGDDHRTRARLPGDVVVTHAGTARRARAAAS